MADIEIAIYMNEHKAAAMERILQERSSSLEKTLSSEADELYKSLVPENERAEIAALIEKEQAEERAAYEARRRFSVIHVCENGEDAYFTSDLFLSFMSAAYRYRLYSRNKLSDEHKNFTDAFIETNEISRQEYESLCDSMPNDLRITALLDFDIDGGIVSVCDSSDNAWWTYDLHDVSVAAYKAFRSDYYPTDMRQRIFNSALGGKEISMDSESDVIAEDNGMQM